VEYFQPSHRARDHSTTLRGATSMPRELGRRRLVQQVLRNVLQLRPVGELALDMRERRKRRAVLPNDEMRLCGAAQTDLRELA